MKTILITGGAGFIGSHVVRLFVNKYPEYKIVNLDKLTYAGNLNNLKDVENKPNYEFVKGDIVDTVELEDVIEKGDDDIPEIDQITELSSATEEEGDIIAEVAGENIGEKDIIEEMEESAMEDDGLEGQMDKEEIDLEEEIVEKKGKKK